MSRIYVDKDSKIERTDLYLVKLTLSDGTVIEDLEPRRLFPLSDTDHYITLLDKREKEVALVRDMGALDSASRRALEECFDEFYMIPKITQVLQAEENSVRSPSPS